MQTWDLVRHPDTPASHVRTIAARVTSDGAWVRLRWKIAGAGALVVPKFAGKGRADGLWRTTCFEMFLKRPGEPSYVELNLSPSERWAAYDFADTREGMAERPMAREPVCTLRMGEKMAIFDAALPASTLPPRPWTCAMTAVIEEAGGVISYWALAHPEGRPDFHDPACFTGTVPAPGEA